MFILGDFQVLGRARCCSGSRTTRSTETTYPPSVSISRSVPSKSTGRRSSSRSGTRPGRSDSVPLLPREFSTSCFVLTTSCYFSRLHLGFFFKYLFLQVLPGHTRRDRRLRRDQRWNVRQRQALASGNRHKLRLRQSYTRWAPWNRAFSSLCSFLVVLLWSVKEFWVLWSHIIFIDIFDSLVGNKNDDPSRKVVLKEDARRFAEQMNIQLFETSAKDNINVEEVTVSQFCYFSWSF